MMHHIDVHHVLRQTVACDLYSNLVTRPTGAAVRAQIESLLADAHDAAGSPERALAVIDFSHVRMIDFSCADEVIAKLILPYCEGTAKREAFFVFRGVTEEHWDAIEAVLERHELALVIEQEDGPQLAGVLDAEERRAWEAVYRLAIASCDDLASAIGGSHDDARSLLERLRRRRLVMSVGEHYMAVGHGGPGHG